MTTNISSKSAQLIAETLPLLRANRAEIECAMNRYMLPRRDDVQAGSTETAVSVILNMLFDQASRLDPIGRIVDVDRHSSNELRIAMAIYSSFGDALTPILKDVPGRAATAPVLAAWADFYWATVLARRGETQPLAA